jgi:hypothetical protein
LGLDSGLHVADLDDAVGEMGVHGGLDAAGNLDAREPNHVVLELDEVVRGVNVDRIRGFDPRRIDEASPCLKMIECLTVLQMNLNELGVSPDVLDRVAIRVAAGHVALAIHVGSNLAC